MKKRKVFKLAKELNLATDTILSYLAEQKVDVSKKHLTSVDEKSYLSVLKHFNKKAYNSYIVGKAEEENKTEKIIGERKIDIKSRSLELDQILSSNEEVSKEKENKPSKSTRSVKRKGVEVKTDVVADKVKAKEERVRSSRQIKDSDAEEEIEVIEKIDLSKFDAYKRKSKKKVLSKKEKGDTKPQTQNKSEVKSKSAKPVEKKAEENTVAKKGKKSFKTPAAKPFVNPNEEKEKKDSLIKASLKKKKHKQAYGVVDHEKPVHSQKKRYKKKKVDQAVVQDAVKETLKKMTSENPKTFKKVKKKKKHDDGVVEEIEVNLITVSEFISTQELAQKMEIDVSEIISKCFLMGMMVTINQRLDKEAIELIAAEFEFEVEFESEYEEDLAESMEEDDESKLVPRSPVVTIMGHVDHGKTSLLDYIRNTKVVDTEAGAITQHIGAYEVNHNGKHITFLDTPGHEAFTAMRARGAKVTDLVVVVIAADDRVMPQTIEAIDHAKIANVPIIIAINKIDKRNADPEKIKTELSNINILVEDWGGNYQCVEISAKTGAGLDNILESILLEAEMLELKANPEAKPKGVVIESRLDRGLGSVATVLVQRGTLKKGDIFVCGQYSGRVREMLDERGQKMEEAGPAIPALILGFSGTPNAGDTFLVVDSEHEAKEIASKRQQLNRAQARHKMNIVTLDQVSQQIKLGQIKELNIILKGDVAGSLEAISDSIMKLNNQEVAVRILHKSVGTITESDVLLAKASGAVILGFHVRPNMKARDLAANERIEIRQYSIIYDLIEDIRSALEGMLAPEISQEIIATVEVRDIFKVPKIGTIAGCYVLSGKINRNSKIKLIRDDIEIFEGKISSLRRHKDDVKEVATGYECGVSIENYNDIKNGDIIEVFEIKETARKLEK